MLSARLEIMENRHLWNFFCPHWQRGDLHVGEPFLLWTSSGPNGISLLVLRFCAQVQYYELGSLLFRTMMTSPYACAVWSWRKSHYQSPCPPGVFSPSEYRPRKEYLPCRLVFTCHWTSLFSGIGFQCLQVNSCVMFDVRLRLAVSYLSLSTLEWIYYYRSLLLLLLAVSFVILNNILTVLWPKRLLDNRKVYNWF